MRTIAIDTETYFEKSTPTKEGYSVSKMGNWAYTHDPRFDCYMLSVCDGSEAWAGSPKDFNWDSLDGATLLSHNKGFDAAVIRRMHELGTAPDLKNEWHCTANMTSFLCNRRSLKEASEHLLGIKVSKAARDNMSGVSWEQCVKEGSAPGMIEYAKGDVIHCRNLWEKYNHLWTPTERALSELTIDQCARGVAIDVEKLRRYKGVIQMVLFHIEQSLPWVAEGAKVTSPKAIAEQCRRVGIPSPPIKSHDGGEEAFIVWEELYGPRFAWVSNVSRYRSINKILTTLETIEERLRPDDTIDFSLLYFGAHTGRWSGGGSGLNLQNLLKTPVHVRDDYSISDFPEEGVAYREVIDMRSLFVARPGYDFIICDLAQIEPRVLNWCAGNWDFLDQLRNGQSIYEAHARATMGWTGGDLKKENPAMYQRAKIRVLMLGYQAGGEKYRMFAKSMAGIDLTEEEAIEQVREFRQSNILLSGDGQDGRPLGLWNKLDNSFRSSIQGTFEMGLPSGRTMKYEGVLRQPRLYKNKETGKMETKLVYTADVAGQRKMLYGGLLTENLVQATSRDVFAEHLLALRKAGVATVFSVHDEAVNEVPEGTDPREIEEIMSRTPDWLEGCPLGAEATVAKYYKK